MNAPVSPIQLGSPARQPFTLLELLVATLVAAVLMAALLTAMSSAWRLQERAHERETLDAPRQAAIERLIMDLRAAVPAGGLLAGPLVAEPTEAGNYRLDDVQWVAAIGGRRDDDTTGDLVRLHYYLTDTAESGVRELVRTEERHLLAVETEDPDELVMLAGIVSFRATWYDGETWQDSWDSTTQDNRLPEAGWIRLEFAARDGVIPLPLEVIVPFDRQPPVTPEAAP